MEDSSVCCTSGNSKAMCYGSASSGDDDRVEGLVGQLRINDGNRADTTDCVERYYINEEDEEEEDEDDLSEEALLAQMGYVKSDPSIDNEEEVDLSEDSVLIKDEAHKHKPINIPTAELNLVSALRGSREKEGRPAEECRVSWAPDVYDPPCTSDDHFAVSKNERHRSEQKGKGRNRQKAGGSEGGGAKAAGGSKNKKKAEKKHKKHGHKYSDPASSLSITFESHTINLQLSNRIHYKRSWTALIATAISGAIILCDASMNRCGVRTNQCDDAWCIDKWRWRMWVGGRWQYSPTNEESLLF
ncbi:uncharacterized protein LOC130985308 [Salvia miltiorrhiza]|uniref:uncharacterized protein LOC130985308 n=1 Tax=Salvia miltiorrhiza TaxID=226208 RepID=UPI0025AC62C4|nr:uncharacterized protein LOC130985308 [Salvia miltiorrhiza]XP_057764207.1 uncharacterized protein LOC130985308 [Salvia miltiorrhiza]